MFESSRLTLIANLPLFMSLLVGCTIPTVSPTANSLARIPDQTVSQVIPIEVATTQVSLIDSSDKIVYEVSPEGHSTVVSHIYIMDSDGKNQRMLSSGNDYDHSPDVSNDGRQIVFESRSEEQYQLYIMNLDGSNRTPIPNTFDAGEPVWGKGVKHFLIFFYPRQDLRRAIYRINADGTGRTQLTHPSPDQIDNVADVLVGGDYLIFSRFDPAQGGTDLYLKSVWTDDPPIQITHTPTAQEHSPVILRDGLRLAYVVSVSSGTQIHIARLQLDGTSYIAIEKIMNLWPLGPLTVGIVDFSSDGKRLYFNATPPAASGLPDIRDDEIFSIDVDGSQQQQLTSNDDHDTNPSVVPVP